ncbi:MAG: glycogen/starch/alpha-glucan phosphorylase [Erysipelotrichales bacterium]|nr:glycogen/starch/alpha-glucan phosphorylase [Erysipelotrichales bacterium]MBQ2479583.1 glycogen/starch/alpha-glucan phosphorylase [Erysipelotrichales bacterium]MBQ4374367.1 glycogen/starch/alpha-glucan phosphorylase [Erysipelotrichales bacterium]MBQ5543000.1 glycogen/starch/alpha-glucan phosphorylase [Erysipelotrichales bacterium]
MFSNKEDFKAAFREKMEERYGRSVERSIVMEQYFVLAWMIRNYVGGNWRGTKEAVAKSGGKQLYYFSMEFLLGKMLKNNLKNLGVYDTVREGLEEMNISLENIEKFEPDAGLGNGGLGRLAACFMDSIASMNLPGHGNCIRYEYGLFRQRIVDNKQVEAPDTWLKYGNPWEIRKPQHAVDVKFYGTLDMHYEEGHMFTRLVNPQIVRAVPYDVPMIGKDTPVTNTLRLWSAECSEEADTKDFIKYITSVSEICQNVYPDDSTEHGKLLRMKQEYFFVSAGVQTALKSHLEVYGTLDNLPDKVVFQLNDTHPTMIIPELMRILLDDYEYDWDDAWDIVTRSVAYTNHTVMAEALETWPESYFQLLVPRIYTLIQEIDRRFRRQVNDQFHDPDLTERVAIIRDGRVHMANLDVITAFSVNGVAALHTSILKKDVFRDFQRIFPEKFNNKTNGVTHRRWLMYSNPELTKLLEDTIGTAWERHPECLADLMEYVDDPAVQKRFEEVKMERKRKLAKFIKEETLIDVNPDTIFDAIAKRLHAYKRQFLDLMHIIYLYQRLKSDPSFTMHPHTYIFAAKAAPAYTYAKEVIELINCVANVINSDPDVWKYMRVVFIPNYSVSVSELLMNAADVSEQISTAGKEASGTGNMKYMMNGAITLGTYDGANVEIDAAVGSENDVIFGMRVEDIDELKYRGYNAREYYEKDPRIKAVMDSLVDGTWHPNKDEFKHIYSEIMYGNDPYFHFADFDAYVKAQEKITEFYEDRERWNRSCLVNIAKSGYFSSDRTIADYAREIWHIQPIEGIKTCEKKK